MAEEPFDRLAAQAKQSVPPIDPRFADRLESDLRIEHGQLATPRRRVFGAWRPAWGLALAAVVVVAGFVGLVQLQTNDPGVPLEVTDEGGPDGDAAVTDGSGFADAGEPNDVVGDGGDGVAVDVRATPTATPTPNDVSDRADPATEDAAPTPTPVPDDPPATDLPADRSPTAVPTVTDERPVDALATPSPTAISDVAPTAGPTVRPTPSPTVVQPVTPLPLPTPTPSPTPIPTPTARPTPVPVSLTCAARTAGDALGVVCEWGGIAPVDADRYALLRSLNSGQTLVIASRRADAERTFIDRDVSPGDRAVYLVRALQGDAVVGASERVTVRVPPA